MIARFIRKYLSFYACPHAKTLFSHIPVCENNGIIAVRFIEDGIGMLFYIRFQNQAPGSCYFQVAVF